MQIQIEQNTNRTKCKKSKIQTQRSAKGQYTNCQNTNVTKYKCYKIQIEQYTNRTKCKNSKIQTGRDSKGQNTNYQNKNGTKYK